MCMQIEEKIPYQQRQHTKLPEIIETLELYVEVRRKCGENPKKTLLKGLRGGRGRGRVSIDLIYPFKMRLIL